MLTVDSGIFGENIAWYVNSWIVGFKFSSVIYLKYTKKATEYKKYEWSAFWGKGCILSVSIQNNLMRCSVANTIVMRHLRITDAVVGVDWGRKVSHYLQWSDWPALWVWSARKLQLGPDPATIPALVFVARRNLHLKHTWTKSFWKHLLSPALDKGLCMLVNACLNLKY